MKKTTLTKVLEDVALVNNTYEVDAYIEAKSKKILEAEKKELISAYECGKLDGVGIMSGKFRPKFNTSEDFYNKTYESALNIPPRAY